MSPIIEVLFCDLFLFCERFFYLFLSSCLWFFGVLLFGIEWNGGYVIGSGYKVTHEVQVPGSGPSNPVRFLLTASLLALWFSRASAKPFQKYFYIFRKQVSSTLLFLFFCVFIGGACSATIASTWPTLAQCWLLIFCTILIQPPPRPQPLLLLFNASFFGTVSCSFSQSRHKNAAQLGV